MSQVWVEHLANHLYWWYFFGYDRSYADHVKWSPIRELRADQRRVSSLRQVDTLLIFTFLQVVPLLLLQFISCCFVECMYCYMHDAHVLILSWRWRRDICTISSLFTVSFDEWYYHLIFIDSDDTEDMRDDMGEIITSLDSRGGVRAVIWLQSSFFPHNKSYLCIGVTTATILYRSQFRYGTVWFI